MEPQLDWKIYSNTSELPLIWDELLPENHYLKRASLAVNEAIQLPDIENKYVLVYHKDKIVFYTALQLFKFKHYHVNQSLVKSYQYNFWRIFSKIVQPKLLVSGHLFRHDVATC